MSGSSGSGRLSEARNFATTQWSVVVRAGARDDAQSRAALAELCRRYWYPLYAYVRRRTPDSHAAQDLTQDFFARLLEQNLPATAAPERGKFRAYLLTALRNFLANAHERSTAEKRGGGRAPLALDFEAGESRWSAGPIDGDTPERVFEREWAVALLDAVLNRLRAEYVEASDERTFDLLQPTLVGGAGEGSSFAKLAAELGLSESATRQAASRFRRRYRELLHAEVAATLDDRMDVDAEIRGLFVSLGR